MNKKTNQLSTRVFYDFNKNEVENYLDETMTPILPDPFFISQLKETINKSATKNMTKRRALKFGVFGTAGLIGGIIVIATSVRTVITILGAIRMIRRNDQVAQIGATIS